jgi:hypothetical protein
MSAFYEWVGRIMVGAFMDRFGSQLRKAGALTLAASVLGIGIYLATREGNDAAS